MPPLYLASASDRNAITALDKVSSGREISRTEGRFRCVMNSSRTLRRDAASSATIIEFAQPRKRTRNPVDKYPILLPTVIYFGYGGSRDRGQKSPPHRANTKRHFDYFVSGRNDSHWRRSPLRPIETARSPQTEPLSS